MEKLQQLDESKDGMFDNVIDRMKGGVFENLDDSKNGLVSGQDDRDKEEEGDEDEEDDKDEDEADEEGDGDAVTSPAVRFGPQMNKNKAITLKLPYSYFHCLTHSAMLLHGFLQKQWTTSILLVISILCPILASSCLRTWKDNLFQPQCLDLWNLHFYQTLSLSVLVFPGLSWSVLVCPGLSWSVLVCPGLVWSF